MTDDLRLVLRTLADRLADGLEAPAHAGTPGSPTDREALLGALRALAAGRFFRRTTDELADAAEARLLGEIIERVTALHTAARRSLNVGVDAREQLRAAVVRASDHVARQRIALDRSHDSMTAVPARIEQLRALALEVQQACERAGLVALNVGIEGLRAGGEAARAFGTLGDELRRWAQRGAVSARELADGLAQTSQQASDLATTWSHARASIREASEETTRAVNTVDAVKRSDDMLVDAVAAIQVLDERTEALVSRLQLGAGQLARDAAEARERLENEADPTARRALETALSKAEAALERAAGATANAP